MNGNEEGAITKSRFANVRRWRHEYKYLINTRQEMILRVKAPCVMSLDPNAQADGAYLTRSLYFDDLDDTCLEENLAGADPRSKFRVRYYNSDAKHLYLEKKSKCRGMCLKDSCTLTAAEYQGIITGRFPVVDESMPPEKRRLLLEFGLRQLQPKTIVTYERTPFVYGGGNVRVTFDRKITSSNEIGHFLEGDYRERPILPSGTSILEVKWCEVMPAHITDTLLLEGLEWTAFSKYYMCRKFHL